MFRFLRTIEHKLWTKQYFKIPFSVGKLNLKQRIVFTLIDITRAVIRGMVFVVYGV